MAVKHLVLVLAVQLSALWGCKKTYPPARAVHPPSAEQAEAFAKEFATKLAPYDVAAVVREPTLRDAWSEGQ